MRGTSLSSLGIGDSHVPLSALTLHLDSPPYEASLMGFVGDGLHADSYVRDSSSCESGRVV